MTTISWLPATFSATLAPVGTGKLRIDPLIVIVRPELAGFDADTATDALWLGAGALVAGAVVVVAVLMPAVHAAPHMLAAQQARASAVERYLFIGSSVGLVVAVRRQVAQVPR